jgi:aspartyl/asparaginyl beta-hydroxylase (cupin superfamily)/Tfp pilus assembly protein PilF
MASVTGELQAMLGDAVAARQRGEAGEELRLLEAALALAPDSPHALNARGMRALADGDNERARACFAKAAAADPKEPALWLNVATACRALRDDEGEEEALEHALSLDRLLFMGQLRMAELNERRGRIARAAQGWAAIVQMARNVADPPAGLAAALKRGQAFLAAHGAELSRDLDAALGADLAALGAAGRRFAACVDHTLGRRRIYHNECAGIHYPFLPADEFFDRAHFPWLPELEAKTPAIAREAEALLAGGGEAIRPYVRQDPGTPENKWSPLDNSLDWSACFLWEYGARNDAVCDLCPETAAALEAVPQKNSVPGKAPSAFFSILKPGAHIPPHTGVTNTRAIIHLPLVVPKGCTFRVGGETRPWEVGHALAFDDTIEHEAWNPTPHVRIVLIFDVWNPHLTAEEQDLLRRFFEVTGRHEGR